MEDYLKNAEKFAKKHNIKLSVIGEPEYKKYFNDDKVKRYVFKLKVSRNKKSYTFSYGQSINNGSEIPEMYDVLSCLTKYDVGSFEDFCSEFGYDPEYRSSKRTYKAVLKEYEAVLSLFEDIIEELSEIK